MKRLPVAILIFASLWTGCGRNTKTDVWRVFDECTALYNLSDTTGAWTDALERAEKLAYESGDSAVWGELYYQKACYDISCGTGDSVGAFLEKSIECYGNSDDDDGKAKAGFTYAQYLNMFSRYDDSEKILQTALAHASGNDSLRALISAELMFLRISNGDMRGAVDYSNSVLPLLLQSGDSSSYIVACGNAGVAYRRLGMNDSAMLVYQKGLDVAMKFRDYESTAFLLNNLSVLYCEQERYGESLQYARKAAAYAEEAGAEIEYLSALANEGISCSKIGDNRKAVALLRDVYARGESINYYPAQLKTINHLLAAYMQLSQYDSAVIYIRKGEDMASKLPAGNNGSAGILEAKANLQEATGDYRGALATIARLEALADSNIVLPAYKLDALKSHCYAGLGDYRTAYRMASDAHEGLDSVRSVEAERKLSEYTVRFRTQEKELEISRLTESNLRQESRIMKLTASIVAILAVVAVGLVWLVSRRRSNRQRTEIMLARKYIDGLESERSRFARELHDGVCNDLLAIGMEMKSGNADAGSAIRNVEKIRGDLRRISHEMMPPSFQHAGIDEILSDYMSHLPDSGIRFSYSSEGSDWQAVPSNVAYELYRITQEAVSNTMRHSGATEAYVRLAMDRRGILTLDIGDNGHNSGESTGVGMRTIRDRAASIGGEIAYEGDERGTELKITLKIDIDAGK